VIAFSCELDHSWLADVADFDGELTALLRQLRRGAAFGRLLELDRALEVKALRGRLTRLTADHCADQLGAERAAGAP
jgi:hypothetical protein